MSDFCKKPGINGKKILEIHKSNWYNKTCHILPMARKDGGGADGRVRFKREADVRPAPGGRNGCRPDAQAAREKAQNPMNI